MEPELRDLYDLFSRSENRSDLIDIADAEIQRYRLRPKVYTIPNAYRWATAAVEFFANDLEGWLDFLKRVHDQFPKRSKTRIEMRDVVRRVTKRHEAALRRVRAQKIQPAYEAKHGEFPDLATKNQYVIDLQALWKARRRVVLAVARSKSPAGKLPKPEQDDLLDDFWDDIRRQLKDNDVPSLPELAQLLREARLQLDFYEAKKK